MVVNGIHGHVGPAVSLVVVEQEAVLEFAPNPAVKMCLKKNVPQVHALTTALV